MAAELRWILAALSVLLLAGIWWWGSRRSRQAPGNAALRESTIGAAAPARASGSADDESIPTGSRGQDAPSREWGVSPFEPLSIRTAEFEPVETLDLPMTAHAHPLDESLALEDDSTDPLEVVEMLAPAMTSAAAPAAPAPPPSSEPAPAAPQPQVANVSETQRIVSIRVSAAGESRWPGLDLMAALENNGLAHGRYNVFHRKHSDGRTLFCAASLVEPGIFNLAKMPQEEFRGLTLFAVLPGPLEPLQTFDALLESAGELAQALRGTVQDSHGVPLSMQSAEALREDVARFQASLTMT